MRVAISEKTEPTSFHWDRRVVIIGGVVSIHRSCAPAEAVEAIQGVMRPVLFPGCSWALLTIMRVSYRDNAHRKSR